MYYTNQTIFHNLLGKLLPLVILVCFMLTGFTAGAQHRHDAWATFGGGGGGGGDSGYGISLGAGYDVPGSDLSQTYKAAPVFDLNVVRYVGHFTFNAGLGYHAYQPKQASFVSDDGTGDTVTTSFGNYTIVSVYAGAAYNVMLGESSKLYFGLNMGTYFTHYTVTTSGSFLDFGGDISYENLYLAPRVGLELPLSGSLSVSFEGKYNLFTPAGSTANDPNVGHVYKSFSAGAALIIKL